MKACGGVAVEFHAFFSSALDKGEWPASRTVVLSLKKKEFNYLPHISVFSVAVQVGGTYCSTRERVKNFLNTNTVFTYGMDSQNLGSKISFVISENYAKPLKVYFLMIC